MYVLSSELGPPTPLPQKSVSPPRNQSGGKHSPAGEGGAGGPNSTVTKASAGEEVGGPNSEDWRKSLALCLLCAVD